MIMIIIIKINLFVIEENSKFVKTKIIWQN